MVTGMVLLLLSKIITKSSYPKLASGLRVTYVGHQPMAKGFLYASTCLFTLLSPFSPSSFLDPLPYCFSFLLTFASLASSLVVEEPDEPWGAGFPQWQH
jgi:hypothetical protein